ncbi:MAG TPA: hypothetical protein VGK67_40650 [Myxococcales bacterium]
MALTTIEAYDLVRFADQLQDKLVHAGEELAQKRALKSEKEWLTAACALLKAAREPTTGLLEKVRGLPELSEVRDEYAAEFQGQYVDALEKLVAGFTFHTSAKDPIIEALYPHQKFPALRKAEREAVDEYQKDLEKRAKGTYVARQLGQPNYAFAPAVLQAIAAAHAKWQTAFAGLGMPEDEAAELRKELVADAKKLDLAVKQAKLLAEAALAPVNGMFEEMGLASKPKKRTPKAAKPAKEEAKEGEAPAAPASDEVAQAAAAAAAEEKPAKKDQEEAAQDEPKREEAAPAEAAQEAAPASSAAESVKPKKKKAANGVPAESK